MNYDVATVSHDIGGMQHVAFHVASACFDAVVRPARNEGVDIIGPVALGGRFRSAYFYDPNGFRQELATDRSGFSRSVLRSVLQTEDEAREELSTLISNESEVDAWLSKIPLRMPENEKASINETRAAGKQIA